MVITGNAASRWRLGSNGPQPAAGPRGAPPRPVAAMDLYVHVRSAATPVPRGASSRWRSWVCPVGATTAVWGAVWAVAPLRTMVSLDATHFSEACRRTTAPWSAVAVPVWVGECAAGRAGEGEAAVHN